MSEPKPPTDDVPEPARGRRFAFRRWSRLARLLVVGTITSLSATAIVGYLGVIGVFPVVQNYMEELPVTQHLFDAVQNVRVQPMRSGFLNILVADLDGDNRDGRNTEHVLNSLVDQFDASEPTSPVRVQRAFRILNLSTSADTATATERVITKGREQLNRFNGDILVWGEVARGDADNTVLRLRFLQRTAEQQKQSGNYALSDTLELPAKFGSDLGSALAAQVAADAAPANDTGRFVAPILETAYQRLRTLTQKLPKVLTPNQRGSVLTAFGKVCAAIADQQNDIPRMHEAIQAYRMALSEWPRETAPESWALAQVNLGRAMTLQGWRQDSSAHFSQAVAAYQQALSVYTIERHPLDWGRTQVGVCVALRRLGISNRQAATLEQAIAACRAALRAFDAINDRKNWVAAQGNLSAALIALGLNRKSLPDLKEAIAAQRLTLASIDRANEPLFWARATHDLGYAVFEVGRQEKNRAMLIEAVAAFRDASKILARELPAYWMTAQTSYADALQSLGTIEYPEDKASAARRFKDAQRIFQDVATEAERQEISARGAAGPKTANALGKVVWAAISVRDFDRACDAAKRATELHPTENAFVSMLAQCKMLTGKTDEARSLFLTLRGRVTFGQPAESAIRQDFTFLRNIGLERPLMAEVEAALTEPPTSSTTPSTEAR